MNNDTEQMKVALADDKATLRFSISGYRPNSGCTFGEIDNRDILEGTFGYELFDSGEWGTGEFSIRTESVHMIAEELRSFINSRRIEVQIDHEFLIHIVKDNGELELEFSMHDQLLGDLITVRKRLSYHDLYLRLLKPFYCISEAFPYRTR